MGHSMLPSLIPIDSQYATSYWSVSANCWLSFHFRQGVPLVKALFLNEPRKSRRGNLKTRN